MSCATIVCSVSLPKERIHWKDETEAELLANMKNYLEETQGGRDLTTIMLSPIALAILLAR